MELFAIYIDDWLTENYTFHELIDIKESNQDQTW